MAKAPVDTQYNNREISWLQFNERVLDQAEGTDHPLLEQAKFLAISSSNLDEFFMVRVGSIKLAAERQANQVDLTGKTAESQLSAMRPYIDQLVRRQYQIFSEYLEPKLAERGIHRLSREALAKDPLPTVDEYFNNILESGLTPISISNPVDFPVLRGTRMGLFVRLAPGDPHELAKPIPGLEGTSAAPDRFVLIPLANSPGFPRQIFIPTNGGLRYTFLEDEFVTHLASMLPGQTILEIAPIRITRNADFELDEYADDFMLEVMTLISQRQASQCIRLEIADDASPRMIEFLTMALGVDSDSVYRVSGPIDLTFLMSLATGSQFADLRDPPWPPFPSPDFPTGCDHFEVIRSGDRMLFHPYQEFDPVVDFLFAAARDPHVLAIKQTLYRTARDSKIVEALLEAKSNNKHVTAVVELKARFDEQRNVQWARRLERAGVDVIYGVSGLKTHAKLCIVVRRDPDGIRRYVHFATGNYNESTATIYSDVSLFTCDDQLGQDAVHAFNAVTGLSAPQPLHKLALAPLDLRETLTTLIRTEAINAQKGGRASIRVKLNSLVDQAIIDELYAASQAGVKIQLNIRGICCLTPGVPGLSENIRVVSIIDRFLEHARILYFHYAGAEKIFVSSADWMGRNLDRRVELLIPVEDPDCRQRMVQALDLYFADNTRAYELRADGKYVRVPRKRRKPFRAQRALYEECARLNQDRINPRGEVFRPLRRVEDT